MMCALAAASWGVKAVVVLACCLLCAGTVLGVMEVFEKPEENDHGN